MVTLEELSVLSNDLLVFGCSERPKMLGMEAGSGPVLSGFEKQQAEAGEICNSSCFVVGEVPAVTKAADSICCLAANRGPHHLWRVRVRMGLRL